MAAQCKECGGGLRLRELRTEELLFEIGDDRTCADAETDKQGEYHYAVECENDCEEPGWWFNRVTGTVTENPAEAW